MPEESEIKRNTVARVMHRVVKRGSSKRRKRPRRVLGIDEMNRQRSDRYLTLAPDLERWEWAWIGKDWTTDTMRRSPYELGPRRSRNAKGVCADVWAPWRDVVPLQASQAAVRFDRSQVVRHLNVLDATEDGRGPASLGSQTVRRA